MHTSYVRTYTKPLLLELFFSAFPRTNLDMHTYTLSCAQVLLRVLSLCASTYAEKHSKKASSTHLEAPSATALPRPKQPHAVSRSAGEAAGEHDSHKGMCDMHQDLESEGGDEETRRGSNSRHDRDLARKRPLVGGMEDHEENPTLSQQHEQTSPYTAPAMPHADDTPHSARYLAGRPEHTATSTDRFMHASHGHAYFEQGRERMSQRAGSSSVAHESLYDDAAAVRSRSIAAIQSMLQVTCMCVLGVCKCGCAACFANLKHLGHSQYAGSDLLVYIRMHTCVCACAISACSRALDTSTHAHTYIHKRTYSHKHTNTNTHTQTQMHDTSILSRMPTHVLSSIEGTLRLRIAYLFSETFRERNISGADRDHEGAIPRDLGRTKKKKCSESARRTIARTHHAGVQQLAAQSHDCESHKARRGSGGSAAVASTRQTGGKDSKCTISVKLPSDSNQTKNRRSCDAPSDVHAGGHAGSDQKEEIHDEDKQRAKTDQELCSGAGGVSNEKNGDEASRLKEHDKEAGHLQCEGDKSAHAAPEGEPRSAEAPGQAQPAGRGTGAQAQGHAEARQEEASDADAEPKEQVLKINVGGKVHVLRKSPSELRTPSAGAIASTVPQHEDAQETGACEGGEVEGASRAGSGHDVEELSGQLERVSELLVEQQVRACVSASSDSLRVCVHIIDVLVVVCACLVLCGSFTASLLLRACHDFSKHACSVSSNL
jgi:hypothetical protein